MNGELRVPVVSLDLVKIGVHHRPSDVPTSVGVCLALGPCLGDHELEESLLQQVFGIRSGMALDSHGRCVEHAHVLGHEDFKLVSGHAYAPFS